MGNIRLSLIQGGMWLTVSRLMVNFLGIASTVILARFLLPSDFGIVANAWTILAILTSVIDIPVGAALIHIRNPTRDHIDAAWSLGLLRGVLIAVILGLLARPIAQFFAQPPLAPVICVLGASVLLSCIASPARSLVQRGLSFKLEFMIEVFSKLATVGASVLVAWIYQSYWALVAGAIAGQFVTVVIGYVMAPYRPRFSLIRCADLWSFSFWLTLSQAIATLNWRFDQILIAKFLGTTQLGIYSVGDNLAQLPTRETTIPLTKVLFPGFSALEGSPERLRDAYQRAQGMLTMIVLPIGVGAALVAEPAVRLAMGDKWLPAIFVIQTLAAIYGLQTIGSLAQALALSQGTTRTIFMRDVLLFITRLPLIIGGMLLGGLHGVVIARVATGLIWIGFNMGVVRSLTGLSLRRQVQANLRPILAAAIMVLTVVELRPVWQTGATKEGLVVDLVCSALVGAGTYAASIAALWWLVRLPAGAEREILQLARTLRRRAAPSL